MTDDFLSTPEGAPDLEARLRHALTQKAGDEPRHGPDWSTLAGRLALSTRRRQRTLAALAGLALFVGAAGGYFGEAAASPGATAARAPAHNSTTSGPAASGVAGPAPSSAGPMACPNASTGSASASSSDIGSDTRVFIRTTADGVTIRAYQDAQTAVSCIGAPTPVAGSGSGAGSGSTGSAGSTGSTGSTGSAGASGSTIIPLLTSGQDVTIELSDNDAVGQAAIAPAQCVMTPVGGAGTQSGSSSSGGTGGVNTPVLTPATTPPTTPAIPTPSTPTATTPTPTAPATTSPQNQPSALSSGTFGVLEGDPVWWVAVEVDSDVSSVEMTFPDGTTDQMAPVGGIAVLAHRVPAAVAAAASGPYDVRGSLQLLGADGSVMDTVTLPQQPSAVPVPAPGPVAEPGSVGGNSNSVPPGVIVACPPSTTVTPQSQSSATTEKR